MSGRHHASRNSEGTYPVYRRSECRIWRRCRQYHQRTGENKRTVLQKSGDRIGEFPQSPALFCRRYARHPDYDRRPCEHHAPNQGYRQRGRPGESSERSCLPICSAGPQTGTLQAEIGIGRLVAEIYAAGNLLLYKGEAQRDESIPRQVYRFFHRSYPEEGKGSRTEVRHQGTYQIHPFHLEQDSEAEDSV